MIKASTKPVSVLPDFRFSGGFMTRDFDRFTRSDLRLTSLMKAEALSGSLIIGLCLVGVTQYSCVVVNIFVVFNILFLLYIGRLEERCVFQFDF